MGLIQLKSKGTAANKLKAIMASYKHGAKKVSEILDVDIIPNPIFKYSIGYSNSNFIFLVKKSLKNEAVYQYI